MLLQRARRSYKRIPYGSTPLFPPHPIPTNPTVTNLEHLPPSVTSLSSTLECRRATELENSSPHRRLVEIEIVTSHTNESMPSNRRIRSSKLAAAGPYASPSLRIPDSDDSDDTWSNGDDDVQSFIGSSSRSWQDLDFSELDQAVDQPFKVNPAPIPVSMKEWTIDRPLLLLCFCDICDCRPRAATSCGLGHENTTGAWERSSRTRRERDH